MILGIEVLCEACGTELEITDVNTDHLLKVTLKARPCPKCNRPPDCHLSCEDIEEKEKELIAFRDQVAELEKTIIERDAELLDLKQKMGVSQEKIKASSSLPKCFGTYDPNLQDVCIYCDIQTNCKQKDDEDFNDKKTKPACFGHFYNHSGNCIQTECLSRISCMNKK